MASSEDLIAHMPRAQSAERDLRELGLVWQMIESSAAIGCPEGAAGILPTLTGTRERFGELRSRLTEQMVAESRAELGDDLAAKAQCAIDMLVRNLYERSADVGFLATDEAVRAFCAAPPAERATSRAALQGRLAEYQAKYSVYDDVILLGADGSVLARLDGTASLERSADAIVAEALAAPGYVEHFRASDLGGAGAPALLYAQRIAPASGAGTLGVLVLRFRFEDELQRIFAGVVDERDGRHNLVLLLLDAQQRVVASSDDAHVPLGARLPTIPSGQVSLSSFAGREYLAVACASPGYQGYRGPGWRAQAMVSLLTAFRSRETTTAPDEATPSLAPDDAELGAIAQDADSIARNLRRVVWNGRLMAGGSGEERMRLKAVLGQVNQAGTRTRERVGAAIAELYRSSLGRARHQARELGRLATDMLDRNLYERANDCRWWALSPALQRGLAAPADDAAGSTALNGVLDHLNGLYTVYSRLVAFDADGVVRAVSRSGDAPGLVGSTIAPAWHEAVQRLSQAQHYAVSRFEATPLHAHGPTWTYLAAVHDPARGRALGGIAIVFHAERELGAMLRDVIGTRGGCAAFVERGGRVLAGSDAALATALAAASASEETTLVEHDGHHYAVARVAMRGYREFRHADGAAAVDALVALRLGRAERRRQNFADLVLQAKPAARREQNLELAVFHVGAQRYALPADAVFESIGTDGLVRTPGAGGARIGMLEVACGAAPMLVHAACARQLFGVGYPPRASDGVMLVLRLPRQPQRPALALRVDDVLTVLEVDRARLNDAPEGLRAYAPSVTGLIDCEAGGKPVLVQLLDVEALIAQLLPRFECEPAAPVEAMLPA